MPDTITLSKLRARAQTFLTSRCQLQQLDSASDAFGARVNAWRVTASDVPCRLIDTSADASRGAGGLMINDAGQAVSEARYRLILPNTQPGVINGRAILDDVTYIVRAEDGVMTDTFFRSYTVMVYKGEGDA